MLGRAMIAMPAAFALPLAAATTKRGGTARPEACVAFGRRDPAKGAGGGAPTT